MQCLSFGDWFISFSIMSSEIIHVVTCIRITFIAHLSHFWVYNSVVVSIFTVLCTDSFLFEAEWYSSICIPRFPCFSLHPPADTGVGSTFWLLWMMLLWIMGYLLTFFPWALLKTACRTLNVNTGKPVNAFLEYRECQKQSSLDLTKLDCLV